MTRWIEIGNPRAYGLGLTRFDEFGSDAWGHGATAPASTPTPGICPNPASPSWPPRSPSISS
jgi:hypothetical protein